jgi:REG-2-like HAD superfamily hydrolase
MKAVLFDAGGTLFTERLSRDELYQSTLAALGHPLPRDEVARLRSDVHDELPEVFAGHARYSDGWFREFVARLLRRLDCRADPEAVRADIARHFTQAESFETYGDVPPCLEILASAGLRLGVVSNWSERLPALLEGLRLAPWFEVVVPSASFGRSKPDPAIFREALRRLELPPHEVLHVGDHPVNDLAGARRAGLTALLLRREPRPAGAASDPERVLQSLLELPPAMGL